MKTQHHISFSVPAEHGPHLLKQLKGMGLEEGWEPIDRHRVRPGYSGKIDSADLRLMQLRSVMQEFGSDLLCIERVEWLYTDAELRAAPLLRLEVGRRPIGSDEIACGTVYDLSTACPHCGTGAVQTSPLMLKRAEVPKTGDLCSTARGDILASSHIADALGTAGLSGLELRQVCGHRDRKPLPWWQMIAPYVMPRISARSETLIRDTGPQEETAAPRSGCDVCRRDMHAAKTGLPLDIVYEEQHVDPASLPDAVQTWECFGRSVVRDDPERHLVRGYARPLLLVKPRVLDLFRKHKVRHAQFSPVRIIAG